MTFTQDKLLAQALAVLLLGAGLGVAVNAYSPRRIPWVPAARPATAREEFITLQGASQLWKQGSTLFLDAREPEDFARGHIGNALNLPAQSFAQHFGEVGALLSPSSELVLYCDGKECELSHRLQEDLRQRGFTNTHLLFNGWSAWREAGLPTSAESHP